MKIHDEIHKVTAPGGTLRLIADGYGSAAADAEADRVYIGVGSPTASTAGVSLSVTQAREVYDALGDMLEELDARKLRFVVDADNPGEIPDGVWPQAWRDLLSAIGIARATGSVSTTSETLIAGRTTGGGRQVFKAVRHPSQPSIFHVEEVLS
jgi:hypothetical protein